MNFKLFMAPSSQKTGANFIPTVGLTRFFDFLLFTPQRQGRRASATEKYQQFRRRSTPCPPPQK
jgi:hypothetical protein